MGQCLTMLLEACSHEVQVHPMLHQSHVSHHRMSHVIWQQHWDTLVTCCSFRWSWRLKDSRRVIQMFQGYQEGKVCPPGQDTGCISILGQHFSLYWGMPWLPVPQLLARYLELHSYIRHQRGSPDLPQGHDGGPFNNEDWSVDHNIRRLCTYYWRDC